MTMHPALDKTSYRQIDPAVLMDAAGDSMEAFLQLLDVFLRIAPDMTARLDAAVQAGHSTGMAQEAHSLKSCLALVGAIDCARRVEHIERSARRDLAGDAAGFDQLRADIATVLREAQACRAACTAEG